MSIIVSIVVLFLGVGFAVALALLLPGRPGRLRTRTLIVGLGIILIVETAVTARLLTRPQAHVLAEQEQQSDPHEPAQPARAAKEHVQVTTTVEATTTPEVVKTPHAQAVAPTATAGTTATPTNAASATPTATATPAMVAAEPTRSPIGWVQHLADAEQALKQGELTATMRLGDVTASQAHVRFNFGTGPSDARMYVQTTFHGGTSAQVLEYITIGHQHWQRVAGGNWTELVAGHSPMVNIQTYLPRAHRASEPITYAAGNLRWEDPQLGSTVEIILDPASGLPIAMQRHVHTTGQRLDVEYIGWNTPVDIPAPIDPQQ